MSIEVVRILLELIKLCYWRDRWECDKKFSDACVGCKHYKFCKLESGLDNDLEREEIWESKRS